VISSPGPTVERTGPLVSVIIATQNRPQLVARAVGSVLAQSLHAIELIVVQDGPNEATVQALGLIDDPRLRVHVLPQHLGPPGALNVGVGQARGRWIALLDDDDVFLPRKLELQLQTARQSRYRYPIVACRIIGRAPSGDRVWPRRLPGPGEPLSEWMFCRKSPLFGEGVMQSDMIFTHRELLEMVPFDSSLRDNDDLDWVLRASATEGAGVEFVPTGEPLAIWHLDEDRSRMSHTTDWRDSLAWIRRCRHLVTPRAYAAFILTWMGSDEARQRQWRAFWPLLREAFRHGGPALMDVLSYLGYWLLPLGVKRRVAALFARRSSSTRQGT
jgi:glycosyltransferase involved in cell wall biosynthesis